MLLYVWYLFQFLMQIQLMLIQFFVAVLMANLLSASLQCEFVAFSEL